MLKREDYGPMGVYNRKKWIKTGFPEEMWNYLRSEGRQGVN